VSSQQAPFAIAVAVGPDPKELDRVADLIDSLRAFESRSCWFVMVDDGPADRNLAAHFQFPANCTPASVPHPRRQFPDRAAGARRGKGICAAIQQSLAWIASNASEAIFTLKMDTDALIIAPFADKLQTFFADHPGVGMAGAFDRTPNGDARDISVNARTVEHLYRPASMLRRLKNQLTSDESATISRHIGEAISHGYRFGEHCLGGAYAVSRDLPVRMKKEGFLADTALWLPIDCPEDVMVGIYTRAVGLKCENFVGPHEVFGVRHRGLPDTPQRLLDRGFSVIHAVKNDPDVSEDQIRQFFREQRSGK
jgi:hypothetical protein